MDYLSLFLSVFYVIPDRFYREYVLPETKKMNS